MSPIINLARRNLREGATRTDVAPREVEEPLALLAEHRRPAQVHCSIVRDDGAHVDLPARAGSVARHQADGVLTDLDGDVHVVQGHPLGHELGAR